MASRSPLSTPIAPVANDSSYRHGGPNPMNEDISGNTSKTEPGTDWKRLRTMTDEEVHAAITADPDIKPTDEAFWKKATVVMPRRKETVTMRLDAAFWSGFA